MNDFDDTLHEKLEELRYEEDLVELARILEANTSSGIKKIEAWGKWESDTAAAEKSAEKAWDTKANRLIKELEKKGFAASKAYGGNSCISKDEDTKFRCKAHGDVSWDPK